MSNRPTPMTEDLYDFMIAVSLREPEVLRRLREATGKRPRAGMQITPEQGQFMRLLAELIGARRALEIGVFTGYSALMVALALPPAPDGLLVACDVSEEWTAMAQPYWDEAGVADRIDLRIAPAAETLDALIADGESDSFDLAFIDADKENYDNYYERCLQLVRPGGLIMIDNIFWRGRVADPACDDPDTEALRALSRKIHADSRVAISLVPFSDGLTLARRQD